MAPLVWIRKGGSSAPLLWSEQPQRRSKGGRRPPPGEKPKTAREASVPRLQREKRKPLTLLEGIARLGQIFHVLYVCEYLVRERWEGCWPTASGVFSRRTESEHRDGYRR